MPVRLVFFRRSAVPKAMAASRPNERVSRNQISLARPTSIVIGVSANDSICLSDSFGFRLIPMVRAKSSPLPQGIRASVGR